MEISLRLARERGARRWLRSSVEKRFPLVRSQWHFQFKGSVSFEENASANRGWLRPHEDAQWAV
jgi:hypothetical protein